jgi:hypothetical protein
MVKPALTFAKEEVAIVRLNVRWSSWQAFRDLRLAGLLTKKVYFLGTTSLQSM